ncbi:MAG TPA: AmmeMemoRadiSam system protein B, partial [Candidatus Methylomirabilis sp.]|nr:AmmeMemoRadiSam system protein B [Candidatus Methylomirabilis sp.]
MTKIRMPAVAGSFYPADPKLLEQKIQKYLADVKTISVKENIRAIMVPHAGYDYSGPVAAYAYRAIVGRQFRTVVLIGSSHTNYFDGSIIDDHDFWQTPLGDVEIDKKMAGDLMAGERKIKMLAAIHDRDHMIEVQLPWLQSVLPAGFKILPIALGNMEQKNYRQLAEALARVLTHDDLLVVSSDMSHYPPDQDAVRIDRRTLELIKLGKIGELDEYVAATMESGISGEETLLCGLEAVKTAMLLAEKLNWRAEILHYANSGDAPSGDKNSVVGYGAV